MQPQIEFYTHQQRNLNYCCVLLIEISTTKVAASILSCLENINSRSSYGSKLFLGYRGRGDLLPVESILN